MAFEAERLTWWILNEQRYVQTSIDFCFEKRMVRWWIRLTRFTLVCEVIGYHLVQVRQNLKKENQTVIVSCLTSGTEQARRSFYLGQWTQRYKTPHLSNAMLNYLAKAWKKWNSYTSHSQDNKSETSRIIDEKFSHERNFEWNILPEKKPPPKSLKTTWSKACQDNKWVTLRSRRNSPQSRSETKNIRLGGSGFRINHTWAAPNGVLCTDWSETWSLKCEHSFLSRGGRGLSAET